MTAKRGAPAAGRKTTKGKKKAERRGFEFQSVVVSTDDVLAPGRGQRPQVRRVDHVFDEDRHVEIAVLRAARYMRKCARRGSNFGVHNAPSHIKLKLAAYAVAERRGELDAFLAAADRRLDPDLVALSSMSKW